MHEAPANAGSREGQWTQLYKEAVSMTQTLVSQVTIEHFPRIVDNKGEDC